MHFTIERKRLVKMLETVRRKLPGQKKKDKEVRLYACAARVFVQSEKFVSARGSRIGPNCVVKQSQLARCANE
jgi:hypothetical protein